MEMVQLEQIVRIREQIKDAEDRVKELKSELDALTYDLDFGAYATDTHELKYVPINRFDAAQAEKVLSKNAFNKILEKKPSSALAKKVLTGEQYEQCQKQSGSRLTVKPLEDR